MMLKRSPINWLLPLLLLLLLQYRLWFDDTGLVESASLKQRVTQLEQDNRVQQSENDLLLADVLELRNGTELLEEKAREDLGLIKADETFILFNEAAE